MHLELFPGIVIPEGLSKILRNVGQRNLVYAVMCALKQPDLVLTESQNIIPSVATEQRKKRSDVKTVGDNHQFLKNKREHVGAKHFWREKHRKSVALVLMEKIALQKFLGRFQQLPSLGSGNPSCNQAFLRLSNQILNPNQIILGLWSRTVHRHHNFDT